ncbi:restriction endonuclease subunit S [Stenotrophomonas maltophilia]|uniref:restriction endonuclease subunit S n=1 Tax=Stenotrophomonas maltophilia TaxID=40324 RepID=UPI0009A19BCC|nr:restriction endonuclease subunit S [Stenotrophomonas maltophilia]
MSGLPEGWVDVELIELGEWGSGGTPYKGERSYYEGGTIPWLVIGDLNDAEVTASEKRITQLGLDNSSAKLLPVDTLLIAMYGSIGKLGITKIECATNQAIAFCKPESLLVELKYLFHSLKNQKAALISRGQGGAQQNISQGILRAHKIPLAPRLEQVRIAHKLDALQARVDAARGHLDRVPALLKRFRQSVLAAATSGELTEEWQGDVESSWKMVALKDVAADFSYGSSTKSSNEGKVPVLRMGNIQNGLLDWDDLVFTSDKTEIEKYKLSMGDVLFNRTNSPELVGKTAVFRCEREAIYAGYLIRVRCSEKLLPDFLSFCLNGPIGLHWRWEVKTDGVSQSNINATKLAAFEFELPPIEEQREIVRRVEALFALADRVQAQYEAVRARVDKVTPALLAKAFRGELVPQNPHDEPACVLLERLRTARASAPKVAKQRRKSSSAVR